MISYKNMTQFTKTLYGVKFKPGEVHEVPGYINIAGFVPCEAEPAAVVEETAQTSATKKTTTKSAVKSTSEEV